MVKSTVVVVVISTTVVPPAAFGGVGCLITGFFIPVSIIDTLMIKKRVGSARYIRNGG